MEPLKFGNELLLAGFAQIRDGLNTVIRIVSGGEKPGGDRERETPTTDELFDKIKKH